jgi:hypothetical protein
MDPNTPQVTDHSGFGTLAARQQETMEISSCPVKLPQKYNHVFEYLFYIPTQIVYLQPQQHFGENFVESELPVLLARLVEFFEAEVEQTLERPSHQFELG